MTLRSKNSQQQPAAPPLDAAPRAVARQFRHRGAAKMRTFQRRHSASRAETHPKCSGLFSCSAALVGGPWLGRPSFAWLDAIAASLAFETAMERARAVQWTRFHRRRLSLEAPELSDASANSSPHGFRPGVWRSEAHSRSSRRSAAAAAQVVGAEPGVLRHESLWCALARTAGRADIEPWVQSL